MRLFEFDNSPTNGITFLVSHDWTDQLNTNTVEKITFQTTGRNLNKPFIVGTSVLGAGAHGEASGHFSYLDGQEVIRTLTGMSPSPVTDQAQVRATSIVRHTRIVYCERKSHQCVKWFQLTVVLWLYCSACGRHLVSRSKYSVNQSFVKLLTRRLNSPIGCL